MVKSGLFLVTVCLLLLACAGRRANQNQDKKSETTNAVQADTITQENVVTAKITNNDGVSLKLKFNNAERTCEAEFNGEIINLKQQPMASGIKYSNDRFLYTEWHGQIRLYKEGKLVFSHDD